MSRNQPSKTTTARKLKVRPKHFSRVRRRTVVFPEIRLCGKWLEEVGFACGQTVSVQHQGNTLILTVMSGSNSKS